MTMIPADIQAEILAMHFGNKKGSRAIAKQLGINRKAVRRVLDNRRVSLRREPAENRRSILDSYKPRIEQMLKRDQSISGAMVLQQLRSEGYLGGLSIVRAWVSGQRERVGFLKPIFDSWALSFWG